MESVLILSVLIFASVLVLPLISTERTSAEKDGNVQDFEEDSSTLGLLNKIKRAHQLNYQNEDQKNQLHNLNKKESRRHYNRRLSCIFRDNNGICRRYQQVGFWGR